MKNNKLLVGIIICAFFIPLISFSQFATAAEDTSLSDVLAAGEIVIGVDAAYPPFEQINAATDAVEGFDPSIMAFIAEDMGVDIVWNDVAWDTIFTSLAIGSYDCVMSAVTITTDRMVEMNFTRWYYFSTQAVMVTTANPKNITVIEDVDDASIKVGIQAATTSQWYLEDEEYAADMVSFATITLAIEALEAGTVDVVLGDLATLAAGQSANPGDFEIVDNFSPEAFGIACPGGSTALVDRMNEAIDKLLGTDPYNPEFSTYYNETHELWMGNEVAVDLDQLKEALDSLIVEESRPTISGASIFSLIAVIPVTIYSIIRKLKKRK